MTETTDHQLDRGGVIAALSAFTFWGMVPVYYKGLQLVGAWEVLAHRVIWAVLVLLLFLAIRDRGSIWKKTAFTTGKHWLAGTDRSDHLAQLAGICMGSRE